ncbi:MAG: hypothetical protein WCI73_15240, partial [Phycisphaerae bacterium]
MDRRDFVRLVGVGALVTLGANVALRAEATGDTGFDVNLPTDKKLKPEWVKALFERGTPEVYHGEELKTIRMPIGGICTGHLDLTGDGALTNWRLCDLPFSLQQGFVLRTSVGGNTPTQQLNQHDFPELT